MEVQTKNGLDFEKFKQTVLAKRIGRKRVNLREIRLIDESLIEFAGIKLVLSDAAFKSLVKMSGITGKAKKRMVEEYGVDFATKMVGTLSKMMYDSTDSIIMLIDQDKRTVVNFTKSSQSMISNESYLSEVEKVLTDSNLVVDRLNIHDDGGFFVSTLGNKSDWNLKGVESDESFKFGLAFENNIIKGTSLMPFNQRLVCSNGMVMPNYHVAHKLCNTSKSWETFYKKLEILKKDEFKPITFAPTLQSVMKSDASLDEVISARNIIKANSKVGDNIDSIIPMVEIEDAYISKNMGYVLEGSPAIRKNAPTNIGYWDLINTLTDFASHDYGYGVGNRSRNIQKYAGTMFTKKPDLTNIVTSPFV